MHVGMLIGSLNKGGAERVLVNIAEYLVNKGDTVTMVTQFVADDEFRLDERIKRRISGLSEEEAEGSRLKNFKKRVDKLTGIWKEENPDVILSFIGKNNFMAVYTGHKCKIPVAVSVRANKWMEYYNPLMTFLADNYLCRAEAVILQGKGIAEQFPRRVREKAVILKNPVNAAFFDKAYDGEHEKTIVTVGRVDENKNHRLIIDAFMGIAEEFPEWKLLIYGDGELRDELIRYVREKGFSSRIELPGRIENVPDTIKKAGVFVLSSNSEGAPNALIEAMILGLPVISTDCPIGIPADLITHGKNGLLIPVGDMAKMQENLHFLLDNIQKRNELGKNAGKTSDIYNPERVLGKWRGLLCDIAAKKPLK